MLKTLMSVVNHILNFFLKLTYKIVHIVKQIPFMRNVVIGEFLLLISVTFEMVYNINKSSEIVDIIKHNANCFRCF